jgi:hypothetical protein
MSHPVKSNALEAKIPDDRRCPTVSDDLQKVLASSASMVGNVLRKIWRSRRTSRSFVEGDKRVNG